MDDAYAIADCELETSLAGAESQVSILLSESRAVSHLRFLWLSRQNILVWSAAGALISTVVLFALPNHFQSTAQFMAARPGPIYNLTPAWNLANPELIAVLKSRTLQDRLVSRFNLVRLYHVSHLEDARRRLAENTSIVESSTSGIISIQVTDRRAQRAEELCNAYLEELNAVVTQMAASSARNEYDFLKAQTSAIKVGLDAAEKNLSAFASRSGVLDPDEQTLAALNSQLAIDHALGEARSDLETETQRYSKNNWRVKLLQGRTRPLQDALQRMKGDSEQSSHSNPVLPTLGELPRLNEAYFDLKRGETMQEAEYEDLAVMAEDAKAGEAGKFWAIKVIDTAVVPERKMHGANIWIVLLGVVFSASAAIFWAPFREKYFVAFRF